MAQDRQLLSWQRRMSSFMAASIIVAAGFFAIMTIWQFASFQASVRKSVAALPDVWGHDAVTATTYEQQFELASARAAFVLERELIARRYDQANLTVTTRVWTRLMGFITGMILALVGAAFVLGKLSEDLSEAGARAGPPGQEWSFSVRSTSPGIILVVMGTVLMAFSISIQGALSVEDQAIYFRRVARPSFIPAPGEAVSPAGPENLRDRIKTP